MNEVDSKSRLKRIKIQKDGEEDFPTGEGCGCLLALIVLAFLIKGGLL